MATPNTCVTSAAARCSMGISAPAAGLEEVTGHVVRDERCGNMVLLQFPNGEPGALQEGTRLAGEYVYPFPGCDRGADHPQRSSVTSGRQRTRVAMRQDGLTVRDQ